MKIGPLDGVVGLLLFYPCPTTLWVEFWTVGWRGWLTLVQQHATMLGLKIGPLDRVGSLLFAPSSTTLGLNIGLWDEGVGLPLFNSINNAWVEAGPLGGGVGLLMLDPCSTTLRLNIEPFGGGDGFCPCTTFNNAWVQDWTVGWWG